MTIRDHMNESSQLRISRRAALLGAAAAAISPTIGATAAAAPVIEGGPFTWANIEIQIAGISFEALEVQALEWAATEFVGAME